MAPLSIAHDATYGARRRRFFYYRMPFHVLHIIICTLPFRHARRYRGYAADLPDQLGSIASRYNICPHHFNIVSAALYHHVLAAPPCYLLKLLLKWQLKRIYAQMIEFTASRRTSSLFSCTLTWLCRLAAISWLSASSAGFPARGVALNSCLKRFRDAASCAHVVRSKQLYEVVSAAADR